MNVHVNLFSLPFDIYYKFISNCTLPVRISDTVVFHLNLFVLFIAFVVLGIIVWIFSKIFSIETNFLFHQGFSEFTDYKLNKKFDKLPDRQRFAKDKNGAYRPLKIKNGRKVFKNEKDSR